jgi:predicted NUDIX family NTP pyrophosphohydrolase
VKQPGGKIVIAWAFEGDADPAHLKSNTFEMEWPPRSGRRLEVPEVDRAGWFTMDAAQEKVLSGQRPFLSALFKEIEAP